MAEPEGRLELTWTNKHLRLLAHDDDTYEWVDPADYRVAEVRLLHDHSTVGDVGNDRAKDNLLIRGDALHGLRSLTQLPEFSREVAGKVRLCYIDPPFNTGKVFPDYDDGLEHSVWLTMLRDRLMQVRPLLAPNGSVWVHCDDDQEHRLRLVMDEVFGPQAFIATVIWQKRTSRDNRAAFSSMHDYIHIYAPAATEWKATRNRLTDEGDYANPDNDPNGPWRSIPMSAQAGHATAAQFYVITTPTGVEHPPPKGRCWTYTRERFEELLAAGLVYWPKGGAGRPRLKHYPDDATGLVPFTIWPASEVGDSSEAKKEVMDLFPDVEAFATPKPERLMQRIIHIATDPGELVLDFFAGSGTTAAVAHKMGRRWIAVESKPETVATFALPRLAAVIAGEDLGGISTVETPSEEGPPPNNLKIGEVKTAAKVLDAMAKAGMLDEIESMNDDAISDLVRTLRATAKTAIETVWFGGGGFQVVDVAPSMYLSVDTLVFLAEWATNGALAETTAAQLGFAFEPRGRPFCGRKGRRRLAVIDGLVDTNVVRLLLGELVEGEQLVVAGTSIDPAARRDLPKGSQLRKIPDALLQAYQRESRLADLTPPTPPPITAGASA